MKKCITAVLLVLVSAATFGVAQVKPAVIADVPFAFMVGTKSLPAGTYQFTVSDDLVTIFVRDIKSKDTFMAAVVTRLSPKSDNEGSVVFDVAGTDHYLSEIYVPGFDGFLVKGAPSKHSHVSVKGKK